MFPKQPCSFSTCDICENGIEITQLITQFLSKRILFSWKAYLIMPLFQQTAYCLTLLHYIPMPSILSSLSLKKKKLSLIILVTKAPQCPIIFSHPVLPIQPAAKSPMRKATGPPLNVDYLMDTVLKRPFSAENSRIAIHL